MKLFLASLVLALSTTSFAEVITKSRVLKDSTTLVALELNKVSVFCTDLGYGNVQLKINVPELDQIAHFNHRVVGEGLPCITAGRCTGTLNPEKIIDDKKPIEIVPVRVVLTENLLVDTDAKTCTRNIQEDVQSIIRGHEFTHHRDEMTGTEKMEKCEKILALSR